MVEKDSEGRHRKRLGLEYMADSAEQIGESIDRTGLRNEVDEAFRAAIARAEEPISGNEFPRARKYG